MYLFIDNYTYIYIHKHIHIYTDTYIYMTIYILPYFRSGGTGSGPGALNCSVELILYIHTVMKGLFRYLFINIYVHIDVFMQILKYPYMYIYIKLYSYVLMHIYIYLSRAKPGEFIVWGVDALINQLNNLVGMYSNFKI
jgi:hypothetical protein